MTKSEELTTLQLEEIVRGMKSKFFIFQIRLISIKEVWEAEPFAFIYSCIVS